MLGPLSPPPSTIGSVRMSFVPYGWLLSQNRPIYKSTSTKAATNAVKLSHLSPYKPGSPPSISKDLGSTNIQPKIVHDSAYKSYVTIISQVIDYTSEFATNITRGSNSGSQSYTTQHRFQYSDRSLSFPTKSTRRDNNRATFAQGPNPPPWLGQGNSCSSHGISHYLQ